MKNSKKFDFKKRKDLTIHSLNQVNNFLLNFNKSVKSFKIFKLLK